ncbi:MAG: ribosome maturation factor RimP [Nitritalea sp.]
MMDKVQVVSDLVQRHLPDERYYLVDVRIKPVSGRMRVEVLIDADHGLEIDVCAAVSRAVGAELEEQAVFEDAYVLECSSPGVDFPLQTPRQYTKNIGRQLQVNITTGLALEGKLTEVQEGGIQLLVKEKVKGKKAEEKSIVLPFEEIKKSIVLVSFK